MTSNNSPATTQVIEQVEQDIERRSLNGCYIYFLGWLAIGIGTDFYREQTEWFYGIAGALFLLGAFRIIFYFSSKSLKQYSHKVWWLLLRASVLLPCLIFSSVFALSMLQPKFEPLFIYIFMTIFALVSSGTVTYSLDKSLYTSYLASNTVIPIITVVLMSDSVVAQLEVGMLFFYSIYMLFQGRQLNKEYLEKLTQKQTLKELSIKDALTGIYNRRHFDQYLAHAWDANMRRQTTLSIVIVDIDYFKKVNDQYGHPAGDETIKHIASVMKSTFQRDTDIVARIGGEEFAVIVTDTEQTDVFSLVETLREEISSSTIYFNQHDFSVTVSAGIYSLVPNQQSSASGLMSGADKALYQAKANGRNCTVINKA
ncbi:GGDEF domain-containing protein [Thalassotalea euphylliae]|uniref:diguanylate cyclase n=1 Tax=Thalassotalea euphylliae TaxID=1655234 RepID=A0A3E0UJA0_9GAMM|nr:GGDEF domain-containing protein [Thalassotalea euphylliae]REL36697.1 GGDEF domain-containing protein [Thalassotalea euphylliae]